MKAKIVPIDTPFLPTFSHGLVGRFAHLLPDLSQILILFPSQRNKYYFRKALLEASERQGLIPPAMFTMEEFIGFLFERMGGEKGKVLNHVERNVLLKGAIESVKASQFQEISLLKFISLGDYVLRFFDELVKEQTSFEEIMKKKETLHFPERYVKEEIPMMERIFNEYKNRCDKEEYVDFPSQELWIQQQLSGKPHVLKDFSHMFVAGFLALTKLEVSILKEVSNLLPVELVLHSEGGILGNEKIAAHITPEDPFYHHCRLLKRFGINSAEVQTLRPRGTFSPVIKIRKVETEMEQVIYILSTLRNLVKYQPHRIAIILPDESISQAVVEGLKALGINYNRSMGLSLTHSPLYSFLWVLGEMEEKNLHYKEFIAFLKHPLIKNAVKNGREFRSAVYAIEKEMRSRNLTYFAPEKITSPSGRPGLTEEGKEPLLEFVNHALSVIRKDRTFPEYVKCIYHLLQEVLELNQNFVKENHPGTSQFFDCLFEIQRLRLSEEMVGEGKKKLDFLLKIIAEDSFTFEGDPFTGIQVMGVLEARNLDFDCVILPSMNEGIFPKKSEKDLFLPVGLRKEIDLPYDKQRESIYHYYFTQLTHAKKEVYMSYVKKEDGDVRSRWIDFLIEEGNLVDESPVPLVRVRQEIKAKEIRKQKGVIEKVKRSGLTPSALRDYKICPYLFYLKYILKVKEPEIIEEEASAKKWGEIFHKALRDFYKKDYPEGFLVGEKSRANERLFSRFKEKFHAIFSSPKPSNIFDIDIWKSRLNTLIDIDAERFGMGFKPWGVEKELDYGLLLSAGEKIRILGRADRVDEKDGKLYIIDYKTGNKPPPKDYEIGDGFKEFQLPVYGLALSSSPGKIGGLIYYYFDRERFACQNIVEDRDEYLEDFRRDVLNPTIEEIISPQKSFIQTDDLNQCRRCAYLDYCGRSVVLVEG